MQRARNKNVALGTLLIALGLGIFGMQFADGFGESVVFFVLGGAFLAGYFSRGAYGLLIPGCILLGLGLGSVLDSTVFRLGNFYSIGLGVGFVAIFAIHLTHRGSAHWWPLIPGAILIATGVSSGSERFERMLTVGWPLVFVLVGFLILFGGSRVTSRRDPSTNGE